MLLKELSAKFDSETSYCILSDEEILIFDMVENLIKKFTNVGYEVIEVSKSESPTPKRVPQKVCLFNIQTFYSCL